MAFAEWVSGLNSPFNIRFASFPVTIPQAALSSNSWSKPGLSPYEAYFDHLVEYVSPGNGLLSIKQDDLYLPGRGLDLDVARAFSTPYAFHYSSSPYMYDNYTLSNIGYGWSLNFPWLGTNYLHLLDGQAYPYSWVGSTFEYHGALDFKLVNNGNGYTLYTSDGTICQFDSSKKLTSITDRTGNNVISFAYGANNYVSQVTDTLGRTVTFSYTNNQLTSITSGGRTWTYGYSVNDLVSVTDPLNRVTTYQYNTGINS
ncbi:MAG: RHS repeat protein, partial [Thaumarchaeota archaeon]